MTTHVTETAAAPSELAVKHFEEMLAFETDCWDVHEGLKSADPDFIVVDVRGPNAFAKGHMKDAINIPHSEMTATRMAKYPTDKMFVVYCAGPHCNGANKAALRLARLGLPVKMMIGGRRDWLDRRRFHIDAVVNGRLESTSRVTTSFGSTFTKLDFKMIVRSARQQRNGSLEYLIVNQFGAAQHAVAARDVSLVRCLFTARRCSSSS